jgi:FMN phosphatase YigB (HAD superfamily)
MIKTLIFDKGNVINFFDHSILFKQLSQLSGYSPEQIKERLLYSGLDNDYHTGDISSEEFFEGVSRMLGLSIHFDEFRKIYNSIHLDENRELVEFLRNIKGRYKIIMLSDTNEMHNEYSLQRYSYWDVFHDRIFSNEVHASKHMNPERIFGLAIERAGCLPQECLFVDDVEANVKAASWFGIKSILFVGNKELMRKFKHIGIM